MNESPTKARLDTLDSADIMRLLPHRYPFLLVDRIIDMDGDRSATGIKNVTANEPYFQGHIPGNLIMPGVLLIEGMAQTAAALCISFAQALKEAPPCLLHGNRQSSLPTPGIPRRHNFLSYKEDAQPRRYLAFQGSSCRQRHLCRRGGDQCSGSGRRAALRRSLSNSVVRQ